MTIEEQQASTSAAATTAMSPLQAAEQKHAATKAGPSSSNAPSSSHDPYPDFAYSGSLRPAYPLSKNPRVPAHIVKPNYAREEVSQNFWAFWWEWMRSRNIRVNTPEDIEGVRKAAILAREVLMLARDAIAAGTPTDAIDQVVFREAIARDCYPSPLNYHGYPKSVCTSVNECICHGIPDQRPLKPDDIINIDVTLYHKGYHGDLNATWPVDAQHHPPGSPGERLISTARRCLDEAIAICGPGVHYGEIGKTIQPIAEKEGFGVVKRYTGHGVGKVFHGAPTIFHHKTKKAYGIMEVGHIFTIEPMISATAPPVGCGDLSWPDDWTVTTTDGAHSAAAEETLVITPHGVEILTAEGGPRVIDTRHRREDKGLLTRAKERMEWEEEKAKRSGVSAAPQPSAEPATNGRQGDDDVSSEAREEKRVKV